MRQDATTVARTLYERTRQNAAITAMMGAPLPGTIQAATYEDILVHVETVLALGAEFSMHLDPAARDIWGKGESDLRQMCEARAKGRRRRAGAKALVAKYGQDGAARIIERKTGKHHTLRG